MITDGYTAGLAGILWLIGATAGVATLAVPWTLGAWLYWQLITWATTTRPAWQLRAWRSRRRVRG